MQPGRRPARRRPGIPGPPRREDTKAMTDDISPNGALPPAQRALHEIATGSENVIALSTLAVSDVLLPGPAADDYPEGVDGAELPREIQLPVYEQEDGRQ